MIRTWDSKGRGRLTLCFVIFGAVLYSIFYFLPGVAAQSVCNVDGFKACANTFNLQGCIDACPYVPRECPAGTSPNTECKETDKTCSDQCLTRADTHLDNCLKSNNCIKEEIQAGLQGNPIPPRSALPPSSPTQKFLSPSPQEIYRSLNDSDFQEETEALADTKPQKNGESEREDPKCKHDAAICSVSGEVEILLPGDDTPIELSKGLKDGTISLPYKIPEKAQVFTGDETIVRIKLDGGKATVTVDALSEFTLDEFNIERSLAQPSILTRMRLKTGKVDVDIQKGEFTSDMKIATPANTGTVTGTHFAVAYDERTGISIFEIYDGTITVTNDKTNKTISLTSSYDKPIKRAEISDEGEIALKIAIPKDEWRMEKKGNRSLDLKTLIAIGLGAGAVIILSYMLFRKKLTKEHHPGTVATAKMNRNMKIVLVLVIGLLLGYIAHPFLNPSQQPAQKQASPPVRESAPTPRVGWKTFEDKANGISFEYPSDWTISRESQVFEQGDLVDVRKLGETQQKETEFYDGGRFTVMTPLATNDDLETWVNRRASADDKVSDVIIHGVAFKKVYTCGLGCFTYYYTISNGKAYGVLAFAEGSKKAEYQKAIDNMLKTLVLPK